MKKIRKKINNSFLTLRKHRIGLLVLLGMLIGFGYWIFADLPMEKSEQAMPNLNSQFVKYTGTDDHEDGIALSACASAAITIPAAAATTRNSGANIPFQGSITSVGGAILNGYEWRKGGCSTGVLLDNGSSVMSSPAVVGFSTSSLTPGVMNIRFRARYRHPLAVNQWTSCDAVNLTINPRIGVVKAGSGDGTVTSSPAGINCGTSCNSDSAFFPYNASGSVTLTPTAAPGSVFTGWNGAGCATNYGTSPCQVNLGDNRTTTAIFDIQQVYLNIVVNGGGTVASGDTKISCPSDCAGQYNYGATPTITATPSAGWYFSGWNGGGCAASGTAPCTLSNFAADRTVTATFLPLGPTLNFSAAQTTIPYNGSTTLSWSTTNVTSLWGSGAFGNGWRALNNPNFPTGNLISTRTYTLEGWSAAGVSTDVKNVTVNVDAAPTLNFWSDTGATPVPYNGSTTLRWSTTNTTSCYMWDSIGWDSWPAAGGGNLPTGALTANRTYGMECWNAVGYSTGQKFVTVNVDAAAPTLTLTAVPNPIAYNASSTLTWSTTNANSCWASGAWSTPGWKAAGGSSEPTGNLTANQTYTMECWNAGGVSTGQKSVTVTVNPPPAAPTLTLTAAPNPIAYNASSTLTWSTTNANSCWTSGAWSTPGWKVAGGSSEPTGNLTANQTYTMECWNAGGVSTGQKSVTVTVGGAPSVTIGAVPNPVAYNGNVTISWNPINVTSCWASNNAGLADWTGWQASGGPSSTVPPVGPITGPTTFTIECWNGAGFSTGQQSVIVGVDYTCGGSFPINGVMCAGDNTGLSGLTNWSLVGVCGPTKCEATCPANYHASGGNCVPDGTCTDADPVHATLCPGAGSGVLVNTPKVVVESCTAGQKCEFTCNTGYIKFNNQCIQENRYHEINP